MLELTHDHTTILKYSDDEYEGFYFEIVETNDRLDGEPIWDVYVFGTKQQEIRFPVFGIAKSKCSFAELLTMIESEAYEHIEYCIDNWEMLDGARRCDTPREELGI